MMDAEREAAVWARVRGAAGGTPWLPPLEEHDGNPPPAVPCPEEKSAPKAVCRTTCPSPRLLLAAAVLWIAVCRRSGC